MKARSKPIATVIAAVFVLLCIYVAAISNRRSAYAALDRANALRMAGMATIRFVQEYDSLPTSLEQLVEEGLVRLRGSEIEDGAFFVPVHVFEQCRIVLEYDGKPVTNAKTLVECVAGDEHRLAIVRMEGVPEDTAEEIDRWVVRQFAK